VSHLTAGNEERTVSSPFQVFETFDFDYQARIFLVNVPASLWFSTIASSQTSSNPHLKIYDSQLTLQWDANLGYYGYPHNYFQLWKNPKSGNWLIIVDGSTSSNASLTFHASVDTALACLSGQYYTNEFHYYGQGLYYQTQLTNAPFLGFDIMGLANVRTDIFLVDSDGSIQYAPYSTSKFDVNHDVILTPKNGTWFIVFIGSYLSKIVYRTTAVSDSIELYPFADSFSSDFDGKVNYVSFNVSRLSTLDINVTSQVASDSWLWLHTPDGRVWDSYHFTTREQFRRFTYSNPLDGEWRLCIVQETFANLTIVCGGLSKPPTKPTGIFVAFIYPSDAQIFRINASEVVLPEMNGTMNVVANVTDYYHSLQSVRLYCNGGTNFTSMTYNPISMFYEVSFDTRSLPDGLSELVIYAQCQQSEIGIGSIAIRVNNNGTLPPIDDVTPPVISDVHQDPENVSAGQGPRIWAVVVDRDTGVSLVILSYSSDSEFTWQNITMSKEGEFNYTAVIPGSPSGAEIMYSITAYDYVLNHASYSGGYPVIPEYTWLLLLPMFLIAILVQIVYHNKGKPSCRKRQSPQSIIQRSR
jgi:hypothetical protein